MTAPNLSTFKPTNADELLSGVLGQVASVAGADWTSIEAALTPYLTTLATAAWETAQDVESGAASQSQADLAIHTQELLLANAIQYTVVATYKLAQDIRDAAVSVVVAAIRNLTGIPLSF